jgi:signal transduction histidine kinase
VRGRCADGVLTFRNRVARDAAAGATLRHVDDLAGLHEGDPRHPLARALAGEVFVHREMTLHRPGSRGRAVMVDACPLAGADGTIIGAVASGYDVTVLRERESELAAFSGVVAHDLKAPLAAVLGYADAATSQQPQIDIDPLTEVCADPVMIRQLLDNLIGNAIKYTRTGEPARVHVWAATGDAGLRLHVDDHGIGIPADQQAEIFTAFHRAHAGQSYAGTGLGLAICERVVTRHHGTITARTNPAGGTRITVTLPSRQPATETDASLFAPSAFATSAP